MRKINDLSDAEKFDFAQDMTEAHSNAAEIVIKIADKYGISRDETMEQFAIVLRTIAKLEVFENYETSEEVKHANRS